MPVRLLNSSVIKWPDHRTVDQASRRWIEQQKASHPELLRAAYFGSYARGDWGVGSDLDLLVIVSQSSSTFDQRSTAWNTLDLPVPAELLVYTSKEWHTLLHGERPFARQIERQAVWIYP